MANSNGKNGFFLAMRDLLPVVAVASVLWVGVNAFNDLPHRRYDSWRSDVSLPLQAPAVLDGFGPGPSTGDSDAAATSVPSLDEVVYRVRACASEKAVPGMKWRLPRLRNRAGCNLGSGFFVEWHDGRVVFVTCSHVAGSGGSVSIQIAGQWERAELVGADPSIDIAVFTCPGYTGSGLRVGDVSSGDSIRVAGFGRTGKLEVRSGTVRVVDSSRLTGRLVGSCPLFPGDSGCPMVDESGSAVGVCWGRSDGNSRATPASYLSRIL